MLLDGFDITARCTGLITNHIVIIRLQQGQRRPIRIGPARLDAAPIGFAVDESVRSVSEAKHVGVVQLTVDERPRVELRDGDGLDFLERTQRHHFAHPVSGEMYALDSSDFEAQPDTLRMKGHFDGVLMAIDQPLFDRLVVFALNVNVLRRQQKSTRYKKREHKDAQNRLSEGNHRNASQQLFNSAFP